MFSLTVARTLFSIKSVVGCAVLLCFALVLALPSGYSYGPILLLLSSVCLFFARSKIVINFVDWLFAGLLFGYFFIHVLLNVYFKLPANSFDGISRFLLVIPVYFLLILHPPKILYLWSGLVVGTLGAGCVAIYQKFIVAPHWERASGFINAIQFGDISLLMAALLLCGVVWAKRENKTTWVIGVLLLSSFCGFLASFLSLSRGGWCAIPIILLVFYRIFDVRMKKVLAAIIVFASLLSLALVNTLPEANFFKQRLLETKSDFVAMLHTESMQESTSVNTRIQMWQVGFHAFSDRPIVGWGDINTIKSHYPNEWAELNAIDNFNHLHNEYIDTLAKNGLIGIFALLALYLIPLAVFMKLLVGSRSRAQVLGAAGVMLVSCVMIFGLTQTFMSHINGVTVFAFWLVIMMAYARNAVAEQFLPQHQ